MSEIKSPITILRPKHHGHCGLRGRNIWFPLSLMGCCGDEHAVVCPQLLRVPKIMNSRWFKEVAKLLENHPHLDWDWYSFSLNVLRPNREHLKRVLKLDDEGVDRLLDDGYVFINSFNKTPKDDGMTDEQWEEDRKAGHCGYYPNFKNFLAHPNELEY